MSTSLPSTPTGSTPSALDVFGPSNPLHPLVLPHLPDVLARIVVHYASPLFPRHTQFAGNAVLGAGCHAAFNTRTAALHALASSRSRGERTSSSDLSLARPFSLSGALTVCGWMSRQRANKSACLLSAHSNSPHAAHTPCMFVGVFNIHGDELQLSTRFADEPALCAPHSAVQPSSYRGWEHVAVTFLPSAEEKEAEEDEEEEEEMDEPSVGERRLYHNGALVAEDECPGLPLDEDFFLLLGRHDTRLTVPSLLGGVCDVRLYSRALDADEVQRLYEGEEVSDEQLEVRWRLDVSQLGEDRYVKDSSGFGRHAVMPGQPVEISKVGSPLRTAGEAARETSNDVDDAEEDESVLAASTLDAQRLLAPRLYSPTLKPRILHVAHDPCRSRWMKRGTTTTAA